MSFIQESELEVLIPEFLLGIIIRVLASSDIDPEVIQPDMLKSILLILEARVLMARSEAEKNLTRGVNRKNGGAA